MIERDLLAANLLRVDAGEDCPVPHSLCVVLATDEVEVELLFCLLQVADPLDAGGAVVLDEQGQAPAALQRWAHVRRARRVGCAAFGEADHPLAWIGAGEGFVVCALVGEFLLDPAPFGLAL
ncbi:Uncharacterised protein [Klebsiella pneumoniae]|nr:Uncharacterised protein [Klebsiella pneumoniae]